MDSLNSNKPNLDLGATNPLEVSPSENRDNNNTNQKKEALPRFLVVKRKEGDFSKISPFLIEKALNGICGPTKMTKKTKEGLLLETVSPRQAKKILTMTKLCDIEVEVIPHKTLNNSKGIIYCPDLLNCTVEEIQEELANQGVISVSRIKTKRDGELKDTPNHILTFNSPILPKNVKVAFYSLNVRLYIPAPLRCFRCQHFGHTSMRCEKPQVCVCGEPIHTGKPCTPPIKCVNCEGSHSTRSKECPVYKQEAAIQEIKIKENLSYPEAKKKVIIPTPKINVSYSKAATSHPPVPPTVNTEELIKNLIPHLIEAIKSQLNIPFAVPQVKPPISKRVRTYSSDVDSVSESASNSQETKGKKKKSRGWPKGKPRKTTSLEKDIDNPGTTTLSDTNIENISEMDADPIEEPPDLDKEFY
ncbi:unnamed protein product [Psylliodes chrysocephalus]|uniref:Gag-like protein n=1 Tax=Psylliodes chrysocephalus TaxID=3402493 RepID=A0A9P0D1X2_9CUCU|nr:unnamed protein product [Psylliodes chrysocephala]